MKKILFSLFLFPALAQAGTLTITTNSGALTVSSGTFIPTVFYDSSTYGGTQSGVGDYVFNLTIGNGARGLILVGCAFSSSDSATGITVGGVSMTQSTTSINSVYRTAIYQLVAPASGSQTIDVATASTIKDRTHCSAASFSGVNQSAPIDVAASTNNLAGILATTLVTSSKNEYVFDVLNDGNTDGPLTAGSGQTVIMNTLNGSTSWASSYKSAPVAGNVSMSWTAVSTPAVLNAVAITPG